jgi:hypothetical protein
MESVSNVTREIIFFSILIYFLLAFELIFRNHADIGHIFDIIDQLHWSIVIISIKCLSLDYLSIYWIFFLTVL